MYVGPTVSREVDLEMTNPAKALQDWDDHYWTGPTRAILRALLADEELDADDEALADVDAVTSLARSMLICSEAHRTATGRVVYVYTLTVLGRLACDILGIS